MLYLSFGKNSLFITQSSHLSVSLEIDFDRNSIREVNTSLGSNMISFYSLIGIKYIKDQAFLLVASEVNSVTSIGFSQIYEIKSVIVVAVAPEENQQRIMKQHGEQIVKLQTIFSEGHHYYSDSYDLSLPYLQNKTTKKQSSREYYNQFIWNLNISRMDGNSNEFQGYIQQFSCTLAGGILRYFIISRRSIRKAGTRFYARGIDDEGNVANFVETQQIAFIDQLIFTNLQIRGSVPVFFAQIGVNGISCEMSIERTIPMTKQSFLKHFQTLAHIYGRIMAVNLLSDKKQQESKLNHYYQELIHGQSHNMPYLKYQFYDFHEQCKNNRFENSELLINRLSAVIESIGFNCYNLSDGKYLSEQRGVFRTNCLDCLDRTNYIQSRIALRTFRLFLIRYGDEQTKDLTAKQQLLDLPVNQRYPILAGFNGLWADNGDAISLLYTSIGSTHTDITRTGERTIFGTVGHKFKSLMRFYAQFNDHKKHDTICSLVTPSSPMKSALGIHDFHTTVFFSFVVFQNKKTALEAINRNVMQAKPALIVCFVFNRLKQSWIDKIKFKLSGQFQELNLWIQEISVVANKMGYQSIAILKDRACWMEVFCRKDIIDKISEVKKQNLSSEISQGEALLIKIRLQQSSFVFAGVNCSSFNDFRKVLDEIHQKGFQISKLGQFKSSSFMELDYRVILGNTGSVIQMSENNLQIMKLELKESQIKKDKALSSQIINRALDKDQFSLDENRYLNTFLRQYNEGPLQFIPTSNRLIFWNKQGAVLRVRDYLQIDSQGIGVVLDYQIGRGFHRKK